MSQINHPVKNIATDTVLELLADERRRTILSRLLESEERTVTLHSLAIHIAPDNPPPATRDAVHIKPIMLDLHHNQLPRLEEAGLIAYDETASTIHFHPNEKVEGFHQFLTSSPV